MRQVKRENARIEQIGKLLFPLSYLKKIGGLLMVCLFLFSSLSAQQMGTLPAKYGGGDDDGHFVSSLDFRLQVDAGADVLCVGDSVRLWATVKGLSGRYSYQWFKIGAGGDVAVSDSSSLVYASVSVSDSGRYYCLVVGAGGELERRSDTLFLSVGSLPEGTILQPSGRDTLVCVGDTLQLIGGSALSGTAFHWSGDFIVGSSVGDRILAAPSADVDYILQTSSGHCLSYDTVHVRLNRASVHIPSVVNTTEGGTVTLTARDALGAALPGHRLHWWRDDVSDLGDGNPLSLVVGDHNLRIRVDYDSGVCTFSDSAQIRIKSKSSYGGGDDDGHFVSSLDFRLQVDASADVVCVGDSVRLWATVKGLSGRYYYQWFKIGTGGDVAVSDSSSLVFPQASLSDSGRYYCLVVGAGGELERRSDTLSLSVGSLPEGTIRQPSGRDTLVCVGDTLQLIGGSPLSGTAFHWSGDFIVGSSVGDRILVAPSADVDYILQTSSGRCLSYDTVHVRLNRASVHIPSVVNTTESRTVTLTARDALGNALPGDRLHWWRDDVSDLGDGNPLSLVVGDHNLRIRVDYDSGTCTFSDSAQIRIKSKSSFVGGDDDGYFVSSLDFRLEVDASADVVCVGDSVRLWATVKGLSGRYSYQWFKIGAGGDVAVSDSSSLVFPQALLLDSGRYYCLVVGAGGELERRSDTLFLSVGSLPEGTIRQPSGRDTLVCVGDTLQLVGGSPLSGVAFHWSGDFIVGSSVGDSISVAPSANVDYILQTSSGRCLSYDTVHVRLNRASVHIPSVVNTTEGGTVTLTARDALGAALPGHRLHWWRDDVSDLGDGNPLSFVVGDRNLRIRVDYDSGVCTFSDSAQIRIKSKSSFVGGDDDGHTISKLPFHVKIELDPDTVCAGEPVAFHAAVKGLGRYNYSWFRVADTTDLFVRDTCCFELADVSPSDSGLYFCVVQDISTNDSVVSDTVLLFVRPSVQLDITVPSGRDTTVCAGTLLILEAESDDAVDSLRWNILKKDGTVERQTLPGNDGLELVGITAAYDSCFIWCEVAGRCGSSDTVLVRVNPSGVASLKPLADNRFGQCDSINLRRLLVPRLDGVVCAGGYFSVDSVYLPGDWWSRDRLRVGCHSVRFHYSKEVNRCINVPEVELCIDTLPTARILLADNTCPGGRMDSLTVVFTGSAPLSFTLEQQRFKADGTHQKTTTFSHTLTTGNRYDGVVSWLDSNAYIVYKVSGVEDRYGCTSVDTPVDTIRLRPLPMFSLFSRYPHREDVAWNVRPGWQPYTIPSGDSVGVKVVLTKGTPEWNLLINDQRDASYIRRVGGIQGLDTALSLVEARTYQMRVARDSFCPNYMDSKYVSVAFRDTGYIRMRVVLEGAYNADSARMLTGRNYRMPDYGIDIPLRELDGSGRKIIDWLTVELRAGTTVDSLVRMDGGSRVLTRDTCLLLSDGTVVDRQGNEAVGLRDGYVTSDSLHRYHIVLYHRNHLSVMTRMACFVSNRKDSTVLVDFTSDTTVYWSGRSGSLSYHMSEVDRGKWALSAGEVNANGLISIYDPNGTARGLSATPAYHPYDVNFDGVVDWPGWNTAGKRQDWYLVKMNKDKYTEIKMGLPTPGGG